MTQHKPGLGQTHYRKGKLTIVGYEAALKARTEEILRLEELLVIDRKRIEDSQTYTRELASQLQAKNNYLSCMERIITHQSMVISELVGLVAHSEPKVYRK